MDEHQAKELGAFLRQAREAAGISIRSLMSRVGIDQAQIIRLEKGQVQAPRADVLGRIAEEIGVSVTDVMTMAGYPTPRTLPNLRPYMRAKYRNLPVEAVDEVERFIEQLSEKHANSGPADGEDEH